MALTVAAGQIDLVWRQSPAGPGAPSKWSLYALRPDQISSSYGWGWRWGFEVHAVLRPGAGGDVRVPLWFVGVLIAFPTARLWVRRRSGRLPWQCHKCGYNLTGTTGGCCPECGAKWRAPAWLVRRLS